MCHYLRMYKSCFHISVKAELKMCTNFIATRCIKVKILRRQTLLRKYVCVLWWSILKTNVMTHKGTQRVNLRPHRHTDVTQHH